MKGIILIILSFVMLQSCAKEEVICKTGLEGKNCKIETREKFIGIYKGNGYQQPHGYGDEFIEWTSEIAPSNKMVTMLNVTMRDQNNNIREEFILELGSKNSIKFYGDGAQHAHGSISSTQLDMEIRLNNHQLYKFKMYK